jgi:hypothetical protein
MQHANACRAFHCFLPRNFASKKQCNACPYQRVGVAVVDQRRRQLVGDVVNGRTFAADHPPFLHVLCIRPEASDETYRWATIARVLRRSLHVEQIRDRIKDRDGLDLAARALHRIVGILWPYPPSSCQHQTQMPAGTPARHADPFRIDTVLVGMISDKAHAAMDVGDDVLNGGFGLGYMADGKDGVAASEQGCHHPLRLPSGWRAMEEYPRRFLRPARSRSSAMPATSTPSLWEGRSQRGEGERMLSTFTAPKSPSPAYRPTLPQGRVIVFRSVPGALIIDHQAPSSSIIFAGGIDADGQASAIMVGLLLQAG